MLGITRKGGAGAAAEGEGLRSNGEGAMQEPTYWESLRVGWMLFWRIAGSFFAVIFLFNVWLGVAIDRPVLGLMNEQRGTRKRLEFQRDWQNPVAVTT
jgi:hypothetical protein